MKDSQLRNLLGYFHSTSYKPELAVIENLKIHNKELETKISILTDKINHIENKEEALELIKEAHELQTNYTFKYINNRIVSDQHEPAMIVNESGLVIDGTRPIANFSLSEFEHQILCKFRKIALDNLRNKK